MLYGATRPARPGTGGILPVKGRNLSVVRNGRRLLDSVDVTLEGEGLTAILGPNGAGKSLLLRVLAGLVVPDGGEVSWAGAPPDPFRMPRTGLVFQKPVLLRRSVLANVRYVLHARGVARGQSRRLAVEALEEAALGHLADAPARALSGGEQQRLALVRALGTDPQTLLLDEPTASLDPAATAAIEEHARAFRARGRKVVFVTHDVNQARRLAETVMFMSAGRIVETAPSETFFDTPGTGEARAFLAGRLPRIRSEVRSY